MPRVSLTISHALRMTVSVLRPRKSIFRSPKSPTGPIAYWVTMAPSSSCLSGSRFTSGWSPITTPAACTEALRVRLARRSREVVMKRFAFTVGFVGFLLLLVAFPLHAQQAEVTRNVNLRADPSADNPPIRLLMPPEQVQLLESSKTSGYYHVCTSQAEEGWIWAKNVQVTAIS